jgi:pyruvate,water dikinase
LVLAEEPAILESIQALVFEVWDVALRIRSAFLSGPIPQALARAIVTAAEALGTGRRLAVRSSAPGEDSARRSFAGLHESVVGVAGAAAVLDAVRVVWASLWSDAALLYRQELALDPGLSRMAVVVQEMIDRQPSGVAFGRDPRQPGLDRAMVEAVPGPCGDLVDGLVDPDHWILDRSSGEVVEWRHGERDTESREPILQSQDLRHLHRMLLEVESLFSWPPDTEWTGRGAHFTLLQARPITTGIADAGGGGDPRGWYLSLRPGRRRLNALAERVAGKLIPELEQLGRRFAADTIETSDDRELAAQIDERHAAVERWRQIYMDEFIPFAHGVRQLGVHYNDAVRPADPYEFVGLLKGQQMVASRRNQALGELAGQVHADHALFQGLLQAASHGEPDAWRAVRSLPGGQAFTRAFESLEAEFMDVAFGGERLSDRPDLLLRTVLELAQASTPPQDQESEPAAAMTAVQALERRLLAAVGPEREQEAREVLAIGRLSWRLRDDDNVLIGRLESQLLRALEVAAHRLRAAGRLEEGTRVSIAAAPVLAEAVRNPAHMPVLLPEPQPEMPAVRGAEGESPRQLVGQPAAPGLATGRVRKVRTAEDLGRFRAGEVLVCDAIQPTMTHLVLPHRFYGIIQGRR